MNPSPKVNILQAAGWVAAAVIVGAWLANPRVSSNQNRNLIDRKNAQTVLSGNQIQAAMNRKDFASAETLTLAYIKQDPKNAAAYIELGDIYLKEGLPDKARSAYRKFVRDDTVHGSDTHACVQYGELCLAANDLGEAKFGYDKEISNLKDQNFIPLKLPA